jgi:YD repeat-containing protein
VTDADIQDHLENIAGSGNWRYTVAADDSVEIYDTTGKLLTLTDRAGHTQTLSYDAAGKLTAVTDTFGRSLSFTYDASGHIVTMTDPAGGAYNYTYDAAGNLASVAYPDGSSKTYHYEDPNFPNALTGISDENGNRYATYAYDVQGRAISSEHANGADRVSLAYNTDGTTTVTDVLGATRIYGFQTILGVVKSSGVSQPGGAGCSAASSALTYDANGNTASRDDFNGHHTHYWYDQGFATTRNLETTRTEGLAVANGTEQVQPETRTLTTAWHASFRLPTLEKLYSGGANSSGVPSGTLIKTTVYTYDATGNLTALSETDNVRNETRTRAWAYTSLGRVLTADGPRSDVADITTYAYYPDADADADLARRGQLWKIANALGHVIEILAYDLHGHPTQIKNPNGLISALAYDARGRLTTRTAGSHVTAYTYDAAGQLTGVTRPDGSQTTYGYDAAHRLTSIQDAQGNRIDYTLDGQGNRIAETVSDAQGNPVRNLNRTFDTLGRLWQEIRIVNGQNAITAYSHDAQGNLAGRSDPLAHTSTYAYDALNRLIRSQDAQGGATVTAYDTLDQATRITAPNGLATIYTRDAFGQVRHEVSPDTGATTYTYDPAGNLKTRTDARGVVTTYTYDALNRLTQVYWNSDNYVTFQYDSGPVISRPYGASWIAA